MSDEVEDVIVKMFGRMDDIGRAVRPEMDKHAEVFYRIGSAIGKQAKLCINSEPDDKYWVAKKLADELEERCFAAIKSAAFVELGVEPDFEP